MNTLNTRTTKSGVSLASRLLKLERTGRYKEALDELSAMWPNLDDEPLLGDLSEREAAEILLRCGSLIGFHGHITQEKSQERSRDILTAVHLKFLNWNDLAKAAECENYLALSYWRTGEYNEARIWLDESLSRDLHLSNEIRLFSYIIQCLLNIPLKKDRQNLSALKGLETVFLESGDDCLKGDYYNHCGLALDNLGRKSEAVEHFELARYFFERSRHKIYLGTVENNLAFLYKDAGNFANAHKAIDSATRLFRQLKDKTREGFSLDTKALIFVAEGRYSEALNSIDGALKSLRKSENSGYLIDTLMTRTKVLLRMDNFPDAVESLIEAVNLARLQTGESTAKSLIKQFEFELNSKTTRPTVQRSQELDGNQFELIIPKSIGQYKDYKGVWINNTLLEVIGLPQGSLAIVAKTKVKLGELIAVTEIETGEVSCGFYDKDFGIVCLEGADGEPQIFDEKEVRILGRIVGVCNEGRREDGKMVVTALKI